MLVWDGGQSGTIGGGALEMEAARTALHRSGMIRVPLGPGIGQCCGGAVRLLTEQYDAASLDALRVEAGHVLRPLEGAPSELPLALRRGLSEARAGAGAMPPGEIGGWFVEPLHRPARALWLYGAGHVGRAIAGVIAPLPEWQITWIDSAAARFPDTEAPAAERLIAANPADVVRHAPDDAHHLIVTYSHALDLELCHQVLSRRFGWAGLIGSATKWARFRSRLAALGHPAEHVARITCPIGDPGLGKHPQAIALGVAVQLVQMAQTRQEARSA
jgi:xanthine dehydrogenase accessory factor